MRRTIIFIFVILASILGLLIFTIFKRNNFQSLSHATLPESNAYTKEVKIKDTTLFVEVADTEDKRSQGLSGRKSMADDKGMLFIWDSAVYPVFWMHGMHFPLDVIWINGNLVVAINENAQPEPDKSDSGLTLYPAPAAINMALEVNAGFVQKNGIKVGDNVLIAN